MTTLHSTIESSRAWPVRVYRFSASRGWEACCVSNDEKVISVIAAVPKKGSVEIRDLRLRLALGDDSQKQESLVIRRQNTIYWSVPQKNGGIVLQFRDTIQCIEFSDALLKLNQHLTYPQSNTQDDERNDRQANDLRNYMIRLLHDEDFNKFVDDVEHSITSADDGGAEILRALRRAET